MFNMWVGELYNLTWRCNMDEMIKLAAQNGIWTLMSVFLLIYTLKQNENREKGYQKTIQENQSIIRKRQIEQDI